MKMSEPTLRKNVSLEEATEIAEELKNYFLPVVSKIAICGSIRRKKSKVNDIDIVLIPKENRTFNILINHLEGAQILKRGTKLIEFGYREMQTDLYVATPETFETLKLIRTGSTSHNIKLCMIAKKKGWSLHADGTGLLSDENNELIANTEESILIALLGKVVPPEERK
jgi:DNA polymerase/3'-5' exonuclease PolX